ncbi:MAG: SET domain-containing protein-lysine N-methyltransferase [Acidiferrobacterales bacterium]
MYLSYRSPKTEVRKSHIHGKGLFADSAIDRDEIIAVKGGYILPTSTWNALEPDLGAAEIQISDNLFIAPVSRDQREGSMVYLNHSCDPNCAIQGQIIFVAMRDIGAGEELTHDWATTDDLEYKLDCNCGSPGCRGTITGKDWMSKDLQQRYEGWFCWHLQRKIDSQ